MRGALRSFAALTVALVFFAAPLAGHAPAQTANDVCPPGSPGLAPPELASPPVASTPASSPREPAALTPALAIAPASQRSSTSGPPAVVVEAVGVIALACSAGLLYRSLPS